MMISTTADKSDLEKALISSIVFELLAYTAEKERCNIKTRQEEGIKASKEKGVRFGRPAVAIPPNFDAECERWRKEEQSAVETMQRLGLKRTTFYKLANQRE